MSHINLLASDFGNMWAIVLVLPMVGLFLLIGFVCWLVSATIAHRFCGVAVILLAVSFLISAGDAREGDVMATVVLGLVGIALGVLLLKAGPSSDDYTSPKSRH